MDKLYKYISNSNISEIRKDTVKEFIDNGADVNWCTNYGENSLHVAVVRNINYDIIKILVDFCSDIDTRDYYGYTPLMKAVMHKNNLNTIQLLLDNKADVNAKTNFGYTPAMVAINLMVFDVFKIFKNYDINYEATTENGKSCKDFAFEAYKKTNDPKIKEILVSLGFDFK